LGCANYIDVSGGLEWKGRLIEIYIDEEKQRVTNETYYLLEWGAKQVANSDSRQATYNIQHTEQYNINDLDVQRNRLKDMMKSATRSVRYRSELRQTWTEPSVWDTISGPD